ncbi:hypothetical protein vseg_018548 [Gypsophila vaccaria]
MDIVGSNLLHQKEANDNNNNNDDSNNNSNSNSNSNDDNEIEAWLPITESRNGNVWSCVCHLVSSGIGMQAFMLPLAIATLGWGWGITLFTLGFIWQLYTRWLLIQLHESESRVRYSRFIHVAMVAFGPKLGNWLCMLPIMYLSSGQCTNIILSASSNLKLLYELICSITNSSCSKSLTTTHWFLIFACIAVLLLQHPNLHSLTWVSLLGTIMTILVFSLLWVASLAKGRVEGISYDPKYEEFRSKVARSLSFAASMEYIALCFRGHNLILEIQGTLPSSSIHPPHRTMWKALRIAYVLIGLCMFPLAIVGQWAYGNNNAKEGFLYTFWRFHTDKASATTLASTLVFLVIQQLCSYQLYAMPTVDNFEFRYVMLKKKPCPTCLRRVFRVLFVSINLFLAISFPFLPSLGQVLGVFTLVVTFVYPCFMYNAIKKPRVCNPMYYWANLGLGCLGIFLCLVFVVSAIWNLSRVGLTANFFHP